MQYVKNSLRHKNLFTISIKFKNLLLGIKQSAFYNLHRKKFIFIYCAIYYT